VEYSGRPRGRVGGRAAGRYTHSMPTFATFSRLKDKGLAALRSGDYAAAKPYLLQAAECMIEIAEQESGSPRAEKEAYARELLELARDCDRKTPAAGKRGPGVKGADGGDRGGPSADDWVVREKPSVRFEDIAGLDDVKDDIRLKMLYPFQHPELALKYGIDVGGGMLMYGPPGTGKTMFARAVATELDATMFVVTPGELLSKWVNESQENIRKLFVAAKAEERSVIFLDELDGIAPVRQANESAATRNVVPQLLQELDGFDRKAGRALIFLAATNAPWNIDPAMMRPGRLDSRVLIPLPDAAARFRLFELYIAARPIADDVDFAQLAERTAGYSGADIKAVCARAASLPFLESVEGKAARLIGMHDLLATLDVTPPSVSARDDEKYRRWGSE
jgi:transitional endoplasmic reticulum ATPase